MSLIIQFVVPLIVLTFGISFVALVVRRRFERVAPVYFMAVTLLTYLLGLVGLMSVGYVLTIVLAGLFPMYLGWRKFGKKEKIKEILAPIMTPGFVIFLLIYVGLFIYNIEHYFVAWDSFSHWGVMIKETFRLDDFYNASESILVVHRDYPPFMTLFETIWCKLAGGVTDAMAYMAVQTFGLTMFLPFAEKLAFKKKEKTWANILILLALIVLAPVLVWMNEANFYSSIYTDAILAIMLGFGFAVITTTKNRDWFFVLTLTLLFSSMITLKQISIVFVLLLIFYLVILLMTENWGKLREFWKKHYKALLISAAIMVGVPIACSALWSARIDALDIKGQFAATEILSGAVDALKTRELESWQKTTIVNYGKELMVASNVGGMLDMSYLQMLLVFPALVFIIGKITKMKKTGPWVGSVIVGGAGCAVLMLLLYVFGFGEIEGPILASYHRYTNTYWLAIATSLVMVFMMAYTDASIKMRIAKTSPSKMCVVVAIIGAIAFGYGTGYHVFANRYNVEADYTIDVEKIKNEVMEDDSVFVVVQGGNAYENYVLQYLLDPIRVNTSKYSITTIEDETDIYRQLVMPNELYNWVEGYSYIYLLRLDDEFVKKYASLFDKKPEEHQLYHVEGGKFILVEQD